MKMAEMNAETPNGISGTPETSERSGLRKWFPKGPDRSLAGHYRWLMWGGGFFQVVLGLGLIFLVELVLIEQIDIAYPYLNQTLVTGIEIFAVIQIIGGMILILAGLWASSLAKMQLEDIPKSTHKKLKIIIIVGAILLLPGIPLGTAVSVTLLREMWMLKHPA